MKFTVKFADAVELEIKGGNLDNTDEIMEWVEKLEVDDARSVLKVATGVQPKSKNIDRLRELIVSEIDKVLDSHRAEADLPEADVPDLTLDDEDEDEDVEIVEVAAKSKVAEKKPESEDSDEAPRTGTFGRLYGKRGQDRSHYGLVIDASGNHKLVWPNGDTEMVRSPTHAAQLVTGQRSIDGIAFFGMKGTKSDSTTKSSTTKEKTEMKRNTSNVNYITLTDPRLPLNGEHVTVTIGKEKIGVKCVSNEKYLFTTATGHDLFEDAVSFEEACKKVELEPHAVLNALDALNVMKRIDPWALIARIINDADVLGVSTIQSLAAECIVGDLSAEDIANAKVEAAVLERRILKDEVLKVIEGMGLNVAAA